MNSDKIPSLDAVAARQASSGNFSQKMEAVRDTHGIPEVYEEFIRSETEWVSSSITNSHKLLDAGCGDGRLTEVLSGLTECYVGVDFDEAAIRKATERFAKQGEFFAKDLMHLGGQFQENEFDTTVCLWNTIGNIADERQALSELYRITSGNLYISFIKKGSLEERKKYYESYGVDYRIDPETETIYSPAWGFSKSYSLEEFIALCESVGFKRAEVRELGPIAVGIKFVKAPTA